MLTTKITEANTPRRGQERVNLLECVFSGGRYGGHTLSGDFNRILNHAEGYYEQNGHSKATARSAVLRAFSRGLGIRLERFWSSTQRSTLIGIDIKRKKLLWSAKTLSTGAVRLVLTDMEGSERSARIVGHGETLNPSAPKYVAAMIA